MKDLGEFFLFNIFFASVKENIIIGKNYIMTFHYTDIVLSLTIKKKK